MIDEMQEKIRVSIGKNVRNARNALGWKQTELADRSGCISRATIAKIESYNASSISIETLTNIATTLGLPTYMLLLREADWKILANLARSADTVKKHYESGTAISGNEVIRIEELSKSDLKKERKEAVSKTSAEVKSILGLDSGPKTFMSASIEQSRTAGIGIATGMIPNIPIYNGVIASLLAAQ